MSFTESRPDFGPQADFSFAWANNAVINTVVTATITPSGERKHTKYLVVIHNPGAVGISVNIQAGENLAGTDRWGNTTTAITVAAGATHVGVYDNLFPGSLARVTAQNTTAVGAAGAFSAPMRIRAIRSLEM